jgi:2-iminobutanoate/2-iminopropanoate deaminase
VKEQRNPPSIHTPLAAYSHQVEIRGPERLLFLSGQVGMTIEGQIPDEAGDQLKLALENVLRNLDAAGMGTPDLVKLTFYLTEPIDPDSRCAILAERLAGHAPCMTLLYFSALASPALKVEVDAWASAPVAP